MASRIISPPEHILRPLFHGIRGQGGRSYRAAVCKTLKQPLIVEELPAVQQLNSSQVRIDVYYCGINFADILLAMGMYQEKPPLPAVFGGEIAGKVSEVGSDVKEIVAGDHVLGVSLHGGGFAEECILDSRSVWKVPRSLDLKAVAALAVQYGTAWVSLTRRANVRSGESVLVTAAAGGVGMATVDLAANVLNAKVIGAAGGEEKNMLVLKHGASNVIDYKTENIKDKVKELSAGKGIDVVVDSVGGQTAIDCIKSLSWEGRFVVVGFASGDIPKIAANLLLVKNCSAIGVYWGAYMRNKPQVLVDSIKDVLKLLEEDKIHPHISRVFPLSEINEALKFIMDRKSTGKVLIAMCNSS